jgi:hypothetical protein
MDGAAMAPVAPPTGEASDHPDQYVPEIVRATFLPHFYMKFKEKVSSEGLGQPIFCFHAVLARIATQWGLIHIELLCCPATPS